jgi:ribosomal protein S18 acetylase RimI-like enzyme
VKTEQADMLDSIIRITRTAQLAPAHAAQFRAIYETSFPPAERQDFDAYAQRITDGARWFFGAFRDDALIGLATFVPNVAPQIHLLEFLAIASDARSSGIGGALLDETTRALAADCLLEVESDDECAPEERDWRQRRIRFYERHGAQIVTDLNYLMPCADGQSTLPMKLMWLSPRGSAVPRGEKLRACVNGIYTCCYGLPADHPLRQIVIPN